MRQLLLIILMGGCLFFCYPQINKKIIYANADSNYFMQCQEFNKKFILTDLTKTKDSLYIRFVLTDYNSGNKLFFELKNRENDWKARFIAIGSNTYPRYILQYVISKKTYIQRSKKSKKVNYKKQINADPIDFFDTYVISKFLNDTIKPEQLAKKLYQIKSYCELDDSINKIIGDSLYSNNKLEIEISTNADYKYIYWPHWNISLDNKDAELLFGFNHLFPGIRSKSITKFKLRNYHKNHWPKR